MKIKIFFCFEKIKVLTQYKPAEAKSAKKVQATKKSDLDDFIVGSDEISEETESTSSDEGRSKKKSSSIMTKKQTIPEVKSTKTKRVLIARSSSSESLSNKDSSDSDLYDKDLQLFYIRTSNKLDNEKEKNR